MPSRLLALSVGLMTLALCVRTVDADDLLDAPDTYCRDNWMDPCRGLTGSAEVVWLRYQDSEPDSWTNEFQTGSRFNLGYMDSVGREFRARYFEVYIDGGTDPFWSFSTLDLEYAARFRLGPNWRGDLSIGARDARFHEGGENNYEDTIGPVIGLHLETNVLWDRLMLFSNVRYSNQFGEDVENEALGSFSITELQVGLELNRPMGAGIGFVRGGFEAQHWAGVDDNDSEDAGLIGFGAAIGFTR